MLYDDSLDSLRRECGTEETLVADRLGEVEDIAFLSPQFYGRIR